MISSAFSSASISNIGNPAGPPAKKKAKLAKIDTSGVTLEAMLSHLISTVGFPVLFEKTSLRCFDNSECSYLYLNDCRFYIQRTSNC